eukprot:jgi/Botrbrau1/15392/Bobra.43_2s0020.1
MRVLDVDGDGKVSLSDIRDAVVSIYRERRNLAFTLKDTTSVVSKLELIFAVVIHFFTIGVYLNLFNIDVSQVWITFSSLLLAFAFVFGNSLRNLYESVVFLFSVHPYDVGDCLFLNDLWHQVEEIHLQNTTFKRYDGVKIYYPTSKLVTEPIFNISRSANRWDSFKVLVDISISRDVFTVVKQSLEDLFKAHSTEYTGGNMVTSNFAGDPLKITFCVFWEYTHCGAELGRLARARHEVYMVVTETLTKMRVTYTFPAYAGMDTLLAMAARPMGEGATFAPSFMSKRALHL